MTGPVGVAIEASLALGNIGRISAASEYAVRTCCAASMADAIADSWYSQVVSSSNTGTRFGLAAWCFEDNCSIATITPAVIENQYF